MALAPAVIVHGRSDINRVLAHGRPATLLSAPGAGIYAGCLWWRALVAPIRDSHPGLEITDLLDCADASGQALAAIRSGLRGLVLYPGAPGRERVAQIAAIAGAAMLDQPPCALDMAHPSADRRLRDWLHMPTGPG